MARFQREPQLLASLNHANIASIYGLEEKDGVRAALVMELVEGPTLALPRLRANPDRRGPADCASNCRGAGGPNRRHFLFRCWRTAKARSSH
jgi:serine/threonine protein kinase